MPEIKLTINGRDYSASQLRCKHLKRITDVLALPTQPKNVYEGLERWMPFIGEAIKTLNPTFDEAELQEMTLDEFAKAWQTLIDASGIKIITTGETKPASLIGNTSTEGSAAVPAGPTVM